MRGHRRTYVGALPGRIARALNEAGTMNPVILLDEVDKLGNDWRGDPSSALLEVLDPAQNHTFRDHYLEVDLDLSDVLFLATANVLETIPGPLLDRLEIVRLDGYTEEEKVAIARDHLLARQLERNGLTADDVSVNDDALRAVVDGLHAGSRRAEPRARARASCCARPRRRSSDVASRSAAGHAIGDRTTCGTCLGRQRFFAEVAERTATPGVATGLAVTGTGGDVLFIEATTMDGEGLTLTGQLGDVMKESAQIALSLRAGATPTRSASSPARRQRRVHVHVPAGAVPEGRPVGGRHDDHRAGEHAHRAPGAGRRGHDRRGHAPGPGAADRWRQAEGAGGAACGPRHRDPADPQRPRPRRCARGGARRDDVPPGRRRPRRARPGADEPAQAVAA